MLPVSLQRGDSVDTVLFSPPRSPPGEEQEEAEDEEEDDEDDLDGGSMRRSRRQDDDEDDAGSAGSANLSRARRASTLARFHHDTETSTDEGEQPVSSSGRRASARQLLYRR